jgi:NADH-quinone oxidoreductase subunit J
MILGTLFFYLFSAVLIACAIMVVGARNPVHSVFFLILAFFNAAVLFLFVVMMLDVDFVELRQGFLNYLPIGALVGVVLLAELLVVLAGWVFAPSALKSVVLPIPGAAEMSNTAAIGEILYTRYVFFFESAGMVLIVAMIGAIVLTLRHKPGIKRQSISEQVNRDRASAVEIRKVASGKGLS